MNRLAEKYLRPSQIPTKACHGCGIGMIENWILQAIDELGWKQADVVWGTGIGCVGRQTFATWGGDNVGGTHGRILPILTGLRIALPPEKKLIAVVGDGDACSIGISHLIHAARRNLGITVIVEDNMGYESTGGQFSPTTPAGYKTNSSPYGMVEPSLNPCELMKAAGATFVAEYTSIQFQPAIKGLKLALQNDGFSYVHIRFQCNENFGQYALGSRDTLLSLKWIEEHTTGKKEDGTSADWRWQTGIKLDVRGSRPEFAAVLRQLAAAETARAGGAAAAPVAPAASGPPSAPGPKGGADGGR